MMQQVLSAVQLEAFDHPCFVTDQVRDFRGMIGDQQGIVDIGGGAGRFAAIVGARVIDLDPDAVAKCRSKGLDAETGDALQPDNRWSDRTACFNLVLHHLVGRDERTTKAMQVRALARWSDRTVFVNEYIYESFFGGLSGRLIYAITVSTLLSWIAGIVGRVVPSLRANTLGVGVRFRDDHEWRRIFADAGFRVAAARQGQAERVDLPLRLLLIKSIRRNSYRLEPM